MSFSLGCWIVSHVPERVPFTKYAAPDSYTYYLPPFGTAAYKRILRGGILRDLKRGGGPTAVTFAVTARCPCSCYHCSADRRPRDGELTTKEVKDVVEQCVDLMVGSIVLTGGEPMVRDDLPELVSHIAACEATPQVFTSGYYLNRGDCQVSSRTRGSRSPSSAWTALTRTYTTRAGESRVCSSVPARGCASRARRGSRPGSARSRLTRR